MIEEVFNTNPSFVVWLADITKHQNAIKASKLGEKVRFRLNADKDIEAYTLRNGSIGTITKKDVALFPIIYKKPIYFEGSIIAIANSSKNSLKIKVVLQVKREYSFRLFNEDNTVLDTYVSLESLVNKDEIIICNYGRVKVVELFEDHILVEVPHLGKRTIYDLDSIEKIQE